MKPMINQKCKNCTFLTARALFDGTMQWGRFCVLPAYRDNEPAVEIHAGDSCPLVEVDNSILNNPGQSETEGK